MLIPSEQDFAQAVALWREWNGHINVISRKDEDNIFAHHILHSLAIAQYLEIYYPSCVVNPPEVEGFGDQHASACTAEGVSELVRTESPGAAGYVRGGAPDKKAIRGRAPDKTIWRLCRHDSCGGVKRKMLAKASIFRSPK